MAVFYVRYREVTDFVLCDHPVNAAARISQSGLRRRPSKAKIHVFNGDVVKKHGFPINSPEPRMPLTATDLKRFDFKI